MLITHESHCRESSVGLLSSVTGLTSGVQIHIRLVWAGLCYRFPGWRLFPTQETVPEMCTDDTFRGQETCICEAWTSLSTAWTNRKTSVCVCVRYFTSPYQFCFPESCWTCHHTCVAAVSNSVRDGATALTASPCLPPSPDGGRRKRRRNSAQSHEDTNELVCGRLEKPAERRHICSLASF